MIASALGSLPKRPSELRGRPLGTPSSARAVPLVFLSRLGAESCAKRSIFLILSILPIPSKPFPSFP
jgi:hypothetical protein